MYPNALNQPTYLMNSPRAYIAAEANKLRNKGFENAANYTNCKVLFQDIGNIHTMRDSLRKLQGVLRPGG
jgi:hypothetical protein